jgi:pimeloyl-ACP methyl ester carboxylesterase
MSRTAIKERTIFMIARRLSHHGWIWLAAIGAMLALVGSITLAGQFASASSIATKKAGLTGFNWYDGVKPTIVLEHGAWADSSSWNSEVTLLEDEGFTVDVPPNPLRSLSGDSAYLASYLAPITGPIILVGHSYGGAVITNAATGNPNVKALVYVDAFLPAQGESIGQLVGPNSCLAGSTVDPTLVFNFAQDPSLPKGDYDAYAKTQATSLYPGFGPCFAGGFPAYQVAQLAATQRPITLGAITQPSGAPAWKAIPSWDLIGTQDQLIPKSQQLMMAERAGSDISYFNGPHLGLISQPWAVVKVIDQAVRATG